MDDKDFWIGISGFLSVIGLLALVAVIGGSIYGGYKLGKKHERKALTQFFITATEATYADGYNDGMLIGVTSGRAQLLHEQNDEDGRY